MENELEPELARLMGDDEKQLVGVLGRGAGALQLQQLVEREIGRISDLVRRFLCIRQRGLWICPWSFWIGPGFLRSVRRARLASLCGQNVDTSRDVTSS